VPWGRYNEVEFPLVVIVVVRKLLGGFVVGAAVK